MVISLEKEDIQYINNNYPKLEILENAIEWEINVNVVYKDFYIRDTYFIKINLFSKQNSLLPVVSCLDKKIEKIAEKHNKEMEDIHVNKDWSFCLVIDEREKEYLVNWVFNFPDFFKKILEPYLFQMSFYNDEWYFPLWEYAHWFLWYLELYNEWGISLERLIELDKFKDIEKNVNIKWHHKCLCWSGKKIRNCHKSILGGFYKLRKTNEKRTTFNS